MIREIYQYLYAIYKDYHPICDRCLDCKKKSVRINFLTYMKNRKGNFVYCVPCWNYIHLMKWTDEKGTHTLRSERRLLNNG